MKKSTLFAYILGLLFGLTANCHAGWQLYDDFNSGQIVPEKWGIDDSSASITVENSRVKFVHQEGHPNDSSWLKIIQNPETVMGIKAKITVSSCSGDVRARMTSFTGKIGNNYVYSHCALRPDRGYISSGLAVLESAPDYVYKGDFFWGHFKAPSVIHNTPYTLSMIFSLKNATYAVDGQGELEFTFPYTLSPTDDFFKGIGTRSTSGTGTCTVYFDDVYIYRQPVSPGINLLLLGD